MSDSELSSGEGPEDLHDTFRWVITGKTESGKTHLAKWLLFHHLDRSDALWVFSGTGSAADWPMIPPKQFRSGWDHDLVDRIKRSPGSKVIVVDDQLGIVEKNDSALVGLFTRGRHSNTSVVLITQRLNGFSPTIRVNTSRVYVCRTVSASELICLHDEYAAPLGMTRREFFKHVDEKTRNHAVLLIDLKGDGSFSEVHPPAVLVPFVMESGPSLAESRGTGLKHIRRPLPPGYKQRSHEVRRGKSRSTRRAASY